MSDQNLESVVERLDRIARLLERTVTAMEQAARATPAQAPARTPANESLWNARQTAEFLQCSTSKIYKAAEANALPCVRDGRSLRFKPSEIRAHVEKLCSSPGTVIRLR